MITNETAKAMQDFLDDKRNCASQENRTSEGKRKFEEMKGKMKAET